MSGLLRCAGAGAALFIGATSLIAAGAGEASVWVSPVLVGSRLWGAALAVLWLAAAWGCLRPSPAATRWPLALALVGTGLAALRDAGSYFDLLAAERIQSRSGVPLSLGLAALAFALAAAVWSRRGSVRRVPGTYSWSRRLAGAGMVGAGALGACLALITSFGATNYSRPADCAIVLGARVYADGRPSPALRDRVTAGVELYREGVVPFLLMSGGVDPSTGLSEAVVMGQMAESAGVPASRIVLDEAGSNTRASSIHCARILRERGWTRGLLVSHGYHLLRAKGAFRRQGATVFTVPAQQDRRLRKAPYYLLRECVAWVVYSLP